MARKLRIIYLAGPGNVIGTFNYWSQGQDDPSQVAMTFSGQFYDVCEAFDAEGYVIASNAQKQVLKKGRFVLEHRPILFLNRSVILYFLGQILYELRVVVSALRFRADVVLGSDTDCFFVLSLLPFLGIQIVPSLHCVLWPKYLPLSKSKKILAKLNKRFFAKDCLATLSTSEDINKQVQEITANRSKPIINFLSTYRCTAFEDIQAPSWESPIFHVLFAGRLEDDKGVFNLLEIAKRFKVEGRDDIVLHLCGRGSALELLQQQVKEYGLDLVMVLHGYCDKPKMKEMFSLSHVVIVPTTVNFVEGLNQVVVEGVLANRPVITSAICPALSYVSDAVVEVPPDDVKAFGDAILQLRGDRTFYEAKSRSCQSLQEQFYSPTNSWGEAVKTVLSHWNSMPE